MSFREEILADGVRLICGDCLAALPMLEANSVDSVVTDPPYGLGFMGKGWDHGVPGVAYWRECLRVLKPGGHLIAFSGTRTYHRLACAIEDAGFEIRDQIGWAYGSGFPKSHNVGKAIDKHLGAEREKVRKPAAPAYQRSIGNTRPWMDDPDHKVDGDTPATPEAAEWDGWGTALKPSWEPCVLARKPLIGTVAENVLAHGTGAINVDGCRIPSGGEHMRGAVKGTANGDVVIRGKKDFVATDSPLGRWPANIIHDGSAEVVEAFPETQSGDNRGHGGGARPGGFGNVGAEKGGSKPVGTLYGDAGSAARFFYTAKADVDDRLGSKHPTVKPVNLMQYLVRLVTPKGGVVLDCFAGTGTTGEAAFREGMRAVLIEREPEYQADIRRRMSLVLGGQDERRYAAIKASGKVEDPGPLFKQEALL